MNFILVAWTGPNYVETSYHNEAYSKDWLYLTALN